MHTIKNWEVECECVYSKPINEYKYFCKYILQHTKKDTPGKDDFTYWHLFVKPQKHAW